MRGFERVWEGLERGLRGRAGGRGTAPARGYAPAQGVRRAGSRGRPSSRRVATCNRSRDARRAFEGLPRASEGSEGLIIGRRVESALECSNLRYGQKPCRSPQVRSAASLPIGLRGLAECGGVWRGLAGLVGVQRSGCRGRSLQLEGRPEVRSGMPGIHSRMRQDEAGRSSRGRASRACVRAWCDRNAIEK